MSECSLPKTERLKSTKIIQHLFAEGHSHSVYPIRVVFAYLDKIGNPVSQERASVKVTFSVGKRSFPKAVNRTRLKRQMREAYRTQKSLLINALPPNEEKYLAVLFLYVGKDAVPFQRIKKAMKKNLQKLSVYKFLDNQPIG